MGLFLLLREGLQQEQEQHLDQYQDLLQLRHQEMVQMEMVRLGTVLSRVDLHHNQEQQQQEQQQEQEHQEQEQQQEETQEQRHKL